MFENNIAPFNIDKHKPNFIWPYSHISRNTTAQLTHNLEVFSKVNLYHIFIASTSLIYEGQIPN